MSQPRWSCPNLGGRPLPGANYVESDLHLSFLTPTLQLYFYQTLDDERPQNFNYCGLVQGGAEGAPMRMRVINT